VCLLKTQNLTKVYSITKDRIEGIKDVSLEVSAGEILALLGPNGAGKTTFIRMICSELTPDSGEVLIEGVSVLKKKKGHMDIRRRVGYAPENPFFYGKLTGWEFARFIESIYNYGLAEGDSLSFCNIAERMELTTHLDKLVGSYSQGMLRKIILCFAIAFGTRLIILDEPSNGLDPDSYLALREILFECRLKNRAILLSTHQLAMAQELADDVAVFSMGRMQCLVKNMSSVEDIYKKAVAGHEVQ
jgi:ABC-2 type transport system ATP-binding protein